MDFSKLKPGHWIVGIAGLLCLISVLFLNWYIIFGAFSSFVPGINFLGWLGAFVAIAGAVIVTLKAFGVTDVKLGTFQVEQLGLVLGALGALMIFIRFLTETSGTSGGLWLALFSAAAVAGGSFLLMKEAGLDMPDMDDFKSFGGGNQPPPPPPAE